MIPFLSFVISRRTPTRRTFDDAADDASRTSGTSGTSGHDASGICTSGFASGDAEMTSTPSKRWRCPECEWVNAFDSKKCDMCNFTIGPQNGKTVKIIGDEEDWRCGECTWLNTAQFKQCGMCNSAPNAVVHETPQITT